MDYKVIQFELILILLFGGKNPENRANIIQAILVKI